MKTTKHRDEVIDYLRGMAIILIILAHTLSPRTVLSASVYISNPILYSLYQGIHFMVVIIVIASGYSLYRSHPKLEMKAKDILFFYGHRIRRLLLPWWYFCAAYFAIHYLISLIFGTSLIDLSYGRVFRSLFLLAGGITYG